MSLRSSFRRAFGKTHRYEKLSDLKDMTPEQIVRIEPKQVSSHIEEDADYQLSRPQRMALVRLLAIKRQSKENPNLNREKAIADFLDREGLHDKKGQLSEVDSLIVNTTTEMMKEKLQMKDLQNRLNKLNDKPIVPDTEEESRYRRILALKGGNKKKKTFKGKKKHRRHAKTQRNKSI